jgi:hypothetical protein
VRFIFYYARADGTNNYYGFYFDDLQVKAGLPVYHVYGYVKDSSGNPVSGATVWVNDTTLGISYKVTTDSNGEYNVYTYNGINGDNINVDAVSGAQKGSNSGTMGSSTANAAEIDVTFSAVPEFSWYVPIFILLAALVLMRKRNKH